MNKQMAISCVPKKHSVIDEQLREENLWIQITKIDTYVYKDTLQ